MEIMVDKFLLSCGQNRSPYFGEYWSLVYGFRISFGSNHDLTIRSSGARRTAFVEFNVRSRRAR